MIWVCSNEEGNGEIQDEIKGGGLMRKGGCGLAEGEEEVVGVWQCMEGQDV